MAGSGKQCLLLLSWCFLTIRCQHMEEAVNLRVPRWAAWVIAGAVRVSFGYMSTFSDAEAVVR